MSSEDANVLRNVVSDHIARDAVAQIDLEEASLSSSHPYEPENAGRQPIQEVRDVSAITSAPPLVAHSITCSESKYSKRLSRYDVINDALDSVNSIVRNRFFRGIFMAMILFVCFGNVLSQGLVGLDIFNAEDEPFVSVQQALKAMEIVAPNLVDSSEPVCSLLKEELCSTKSSLDLCLMIDEKIIVKVQEYVGHLEDIQDTHSPERFGRQATYDWASVWSISFIFLMVFLVAFLCYKKQCQPKKLAEFREEEHGASSTRSGGERSETSRKRNKKKKKHFSWECIEFPLADGKCRIDDIVLKACISSRSGVEIYTGKHEGKTCIIKKLQRRGKERDYNTTRERLLKLDHSNLVPYFAINRTEEFIYFAMERAICNLDELITACSKSTVPDGLPKDFVLWETNGNPSPALGKIMSDILHGLSYIHDKHLTHGNLKPENILITLDHTMMITAKIGDICIDKFLPKKHFQDGYQNSCWQAWQKFGEDVYDDKTECFIIGTLFFFCLTKGKKPYDEEMTKSTGKSTLKNQYLQCRSEQAKELCSKLYSLHNATRLKAEDALNHPFFWTPQRHLDFLHDLSELLQEKRASAAKVRLEAQRSDLFKGDKWVDTLNDGLKKILERPEYAEKYDYGSVVSLIRFIRNFRNHHTLKEDIKKQAGHFPDEVYKYFDEKFPHLYIQALEVAKAEFPTEKSLMKYY